MNNAADFLTFINTVMAIDATEEQWDLPLVELDSWDSINAVRLMSRLEKTLSIRLSMGDYLQATTLRQLYELTRRTAA
ncbi:acyl carrier protein [Serratia marcescens]|uniref:acyl carrier protein n=1 Tax=Serratia marcescens TaxID=615 RepID=UPI001C582CA3|nr:acyl carrier protein [Serratia marcescens]QXX95818.1 acyl carrier protein [Serratia marcescens]